MEGFFSAANFGFINIIQTKGKNISENKSIHQILFLLIKNVSGREYMSSFRRVEAD